MHTTTQSKLNKRHLVFLSSLVMISLCQYGCGGDDNSSSSSQSKCDESTKPANALTCECSEGNWVNCTYSTNTTCDESTKPANALTCECTEGNWINCTFPTPTTCDESTKPADALTCDCSEGNWINCTFPSPTTCDESTKPADALTCDCSEGNWINCTFPSPTTCDESTKPADALTCDCSEGNWINCTYPPADIPQILHSEIDKLYENANIENGEPETAELKIWLSKAPESPVTVLVEVGPEDVCRSVSNTNKFVFNASNFDVPKTMKVIAENNGTVNPDDYACMIKMSGIGDDIEYKIGIIDDDYPDISIMKSNGKLVDETHLISDESSYNVKNADYSKYNNAVFSSYTHCFGLSAVPSSAVELTLSIPDKYKDYLTLSETSFTIDPDKDKDIHFSKNWCTLITDVFNYQSEIDLSQEEIYIDIAASSKDPLYNELTVKDKVNLLDKADFGFGFLDLDDYILNENSSDKTQKEVSLYLKAKPKGDTIIQFESTDSSRMTVSPSSLTITADNWNTLKKVTVTVVNDDIANTNNNAKLKITTDSNYNSVEDTSQSFMIVDDD